MTKQPYWSKLLTLEDTNRQYRHCKTKQNKNNKNNNKKNPHNKQQLRIRDFDHWMI